MKAVQESMDDRGEYQTGRRDEEDSAEQRVDRREQLSRYGVEVCDRSLSRQQHRGVQSRVQPRQIFGEVKARGT